MCVKIHCHLQKMHLLDFLFLILLFLTISLGQIPSSSSVESKEMSSFGSWLCIIMVIINLQCYSPHGGPSRNFGIICKIQKRKTIGILIRIILF